MTEPRSEATAPIDLEALFTLDRPAAYDPHFSIAVAKRLARRRFIVEIGWGAAVTGLVAMVLWALAPVLQPAIHPVLELIGRPLLPLAPVVALMAGVLLMTHPRTA